MGLVWNGVRKAQRGARQTDATGCVVVGGFGPEAVDGIVHSFPAPLYVAKADERVVVLRVMVQELLEPRFGFFQTVFFQELIALLGKVRPMVLLLRHAIRPLEAIVG